jgi:hypothetical protein
MALTAAYAYRTMEARPAAARDPEAHATAG